MSKPKKHPDYLKEKPQAFDKPKYFICNMGIIVQWTDIITVYNPVRFPTFPKQIVTQPMRINDVDTLYKGIDIDTGVEVEIDEVHILAWGEDPKTLRILYGKK